MNKILPILEKAEKYFLNGQPLIASLKAANTLQIELDILVDIFEIYYKLKHKK